MMYRIDLAPILLTAVAALNTALSSPAQAKNRCEADLGRVDSSFCIGDKHIAGAAGGTALSYSWKVDDAVWDLSAKACLSGGQIGARRDMVLAIDRSESIWSVDASRHKIGSDNLATARYLIQKLATEAQTQPDKAPKVGLVLFSSAPDCREYASGTGITVNREFPCVFVTAKSVADTQHVDNLLKALADANDKYSQGGLSTSSDYTVVTNLLATDRMGMTSAGQAGLMLFSDGRTYKGDSGDVYAYLRSGSYTRAQTEAAQAFAALHKYRLVFALDPVNDPAFDATNADAYDTMCSLNTAVAADCDRNTVKTNDPSTWPINKLGLRQFAASLVTATGGAAKDAISLTTNTDADPGLEALRIGTDTALIDAVSVSINGGTPKAGTVAGGRFTLDSLPVGPGTKLELLIKSNGAEVKVPISVDTALVPYANQDFADKEMFCNQDVAPVTAKPKSNLNNLQGGSASCGVAAGMDGPSSQMLLLVALLLPLLAVAFLTGLVHRALAVILGITLALSLLLPDSAYAEESTGGLNALQYRPVVDGVGNTEKASTLPQFGYNAGLFMSYAKDALELGGEKNEKVRSIMDNLVTAHMVGNVGLLDRVTLGVHVPYVQNSTEERNVQGDQKKTAELGQPADVEALLKISVLHRSSFDLGFAPLVTMPTGDEELLIGDGTTNYGGLFLVSGTYGQFSWAYNAGYLQREKPLELADDRANSVKVTGQFLNYGGVEYRRSPKLAFGGSLQAKFTSGEAIDFNRGSPAEWSAMTKYRPLTGMELEGGLGTGIGKGYGSPEYRVFAGITYVPDAAAQRARQTAKAAPARPAAKPAAVKPASVKPAPTTVTSKKPVVAKR